jgi:zinc D-Ala-D-Ala dipeptidase
MKPYQHLPIFESGEPLVAIPPGLFHFKSPHPYARLGAPYAQASPFWLRQGVLNSLVQAQTALQKDHPNWQILIFDAYRPVAVQQFMVEHTFAEVAQAEGLTAADLSPAQIEKIRQQVYQIWAIPSFDPLTPPPHSTGGAVDISLVDQTGQPAWMGSPIDELSVRSHPDYFAKVAADPTASELDRSQAQQANTHRQILRDVMLAAGFERHWGEWWHFCLGDQMWAWLRQQQGDEQAIARYGRADLLSKPEAE